MKRATWCIILLFVTTSAGLLGQALSSSTVASPAKPQAKTAPKKDPVKAMVGGSGVPRTEAVTTEIFSDEAFFDSANHIGIFTGHVIVNDPRFNVQSEKLTIYLNKEQTADKPAAEEAEEAPGEVKAPTDALEKAVAEGNVGVVRERADEKGGPPVRSVGRADMAIYTSKDGNVELKGTPRVQSGLNTHIATSPDTVMVINQTGQLVTRGPSRTEIRQEPKTDAAKPATPAPKP